MATRRRATRTGRPRFSAAQKSFLLQCLGEEDFLSAESDPEFLSLPGSPKNDDDRWAKRIRFLLSKGDSDDEDQDVARDPGPSLDKIYCFDAEEMARLGKRKALNYVFIDDDEEEDGCTDGIEEVFSFDMERVAEALRRGANQEELCEVIEEAMVKDLPHRLSAATTYCDGSSLEAAPTSSTLTPRTGDLSALMTPPRDVEDLMTPPEQAAEGASTQRGVSSTDLAARLQRIRGQTAATRRRSSIAQHPQLMEAVSFASAQHRQSLAKVVETEIREAAASGKLARRQSFHASSTQQELRPSLAAQVRRSIAGAQRQRRASLIRAAEVLEVAGVGVGRRRAASGSTSNEVLNQLEVVQQAVETAARRHRQSIIVAIAQVHEDEEEPEPEADESGSDTLPESFWQGCVNEIISAAYEAFWSCVHRK